jgi:hypothetical protein
MKFSSNSHRLKQHLEHFRDGSIRRCSVADLDLLAGEREVENGAEVPSKQKGPDERQETSYNRRWITDPDQ